MLKRGFLLAGFVVLFMGLVLAPQADASATIGYVDFEFLFNAHPEYESKNDELQELADNMTSQFEEEMEELQSDEEVEQLAREYEEQLDEFAEQLRITIIASVQDFIAELAERDGIAVVLPDSTVIYGGENLTPRVLEYMYDSYGISVPSNLREYL